MNHEEAIRTLVDQAVQDCKELKAGYTAIAALTCLRVEEVAEIIGKGALPEQVMEHLENLTQSPTPPLTHKTNFYSGSDGSLWLSTGFALPSNDDLVDCFTDEGETFQARIIDADAQEWWKPDPANPGKQIMVRGVIVWWREVTDSGTEKDQ